ncbi:immunoglobulin domain-containing protein [Cellulomonas rhizosphaerae]|uniref:Ig-like domain-containing protein n=1 Tax=Cellulomonas rhizosphaerae TaxID=2293719 RepID=A0A413RNH9_9CELL|nr:immunoglobulin domain-containing protein [Cellulomonas rhizosphaerae]RHA43517.1 hypothetical protein D1825_05985 [Cellulomonas rhizosphaerae]
MDARSLRRTAGLVGLVCAATAFAGCSNGGSEGDCAPPTVSVSPSEVAAGERVTLTGSAFLAVCADTGDGAPAGTTTASILWYQDSTHGDEVATVDVSSAGQFSTGLVVPDDAKPGGARIVAAVGDDTRGEATVTVHE